MRYLLDTNICIYVINERPPAVFVQFLAHEQDGLGISAVSVSELYWGVRKTGSSRNLRALENFLAPLRIVDYDLAAARIYGEVRASLEKKGVPIGPLDTLIAAHALSMDAILVTNNQREFKRVPRLKLENWM